MSTDESKCSKAGESASEPHQGKNGANGSVATEFMLTEFKELSQLWRHIDSRIETALNLYATIGAVTVPATILIYKNTLGGWLFPLSVFSICMTLTIVGVFLIRRVCSADLKKAQCQLGIRLIRCYFVDEAPEITPYMFFAIARKSLDFEKKGEQVAPFYHRTLISVTVLINSFLIGSAAGCLAWLAMRNSSIFQFSVTSAVSMVVAAASWCVFHTDHRKWVAGVEASIRRKLTDEDLVIGRKAA